MKKCCKYWKKVVIFDEKGRIYLNFCQDCGAFLKEENLHKIAEQLQRDILKLAEPYLSYVKLGKPREESKCNPLKCSSEDRRFIKCMLIGGCEKILKKPKPELPNEIALYGIPGEPYSQKHIDVVVDAVNKLIRCCVHHLQGQIDHLGKAQK